MEKEPEANRPSSERFWLGHITRCQEQNLSMAKYASEHGLKAGKLYYWKKRLKAPGQLPSHPKPVTFSRVQPAALGSCATTCRLRFPNGAIMEWDTLEGDILAQLLPLVNRLP